MAALEELGTAQNRKIYTRHGAAPPMFGVSYGSLRPIARKIGTDHSMAKDLWATGNHDARVLALETADPQLLTKSEANSWIADATNYIISEGVGGLAARSPHARSRSQIWRDRRREWTAAAGWFIVACTAEDPDVWTGDELVAFIDQIEEQIHYRPNRVRHEMTLALVAMALRGASVRRRALAHRERRN